MLFEEGGPRSGERQAAEQLGVPTEGASFGDNISVAERSNSQPSLVSSGRVVQLLGNGRESCGGGDARAGEVSVSP